VIDPFKHGVKTMRTCLEIMFILMFIAAIVTGLKLIEGV